MGLLIDKETLELLRRGDDEELVHKTMYEKLEELYSIENPTSLSEMELMHYGVAHDANPPGPGSGRYPFGSGDRELQRQWDVYSRYQKFKKAINPVTGKHYSETEVARLMGYYQTDPRSGEVLKDKVTGEPLGNTKILRARASVAKDYVRQNYYVAACQELNNAIDPATGKNYTHTKIGKMLGIGESSVRNYLNSEQASRNASKVTEVANVLKAAIDEKGAVDVGAGVEYNVGGRAVSRQALNAAFEVLKDQGYHVDKVWIEQVGGMNGNQTNILVAYPPKTTYKELYQNISMIKPLNDLDGQSSLTNLGIQDPVRIDLDRVKVKYKEDGGVDRDGKIEIRAIRDPETGRLKAATPDLDLGNAQYAQVRIATKGDMFIKGMATYNEDLSGCDILVNSNKSMEKGIEGALKPMRQRLDKDGNPIGVDMDNPFGATVWQHEYRDKDGKSKLSAINIVGDIGGVDKHVEGAWGEWGRNLPAQFLSKQDVNLIKNQLDIKYKSAKAEYDEILRINNPVVKKQMLIDFAESCDGAAVDLKAAPLPGQRVQVLLPVPSIKANEIYAPNYETGQTVALIRYPHAGPWEIAICKVNNGNREAKSFMKDAKDAIGVSHKVAEILSGADFDGDTATVIPMTRKNAQGEFEKIVNIKGLGNGQAKLPDLDGFDPSDAFPEREGMHYMSKSDKQMEMGKATNLIMDMALAGGADPMEESRATRYSMVVIDAEKHKLDYKAAEKVYDIQGLKDKYQNGGGASTVITRSKSEERVERRQQWVPNAGHIDKATGQLVGNTIDPVTGEKIYKLAPNRFYTTKKEVRVKDPETGKYVKNPDGTWKKEVVYETHSRLQASTKMAEAKDAYTLLSKNPNKKEILYADFANNMKGLANKARKEWIVTPDLEYSPEANKKYSAEVKELNRKYINAKMNAPRERQAQILATQIINERIEENPNIVNDKEEFKRTKGQALNGARSRTGAKKARVTFTEREWEAINAGAVSTTRLTELLKNADQDSYRSLALPRATRVSRSTADYITSLLNAGWTREEIVDAGYASMTTIEKVQRGQVG